MTREKKKLNFIPSIPDIKPSNLPYYDREKTERLIGILVDMIAHPPEHLRDLDPVAQAENDRQLEELSVEIERQEVLELERRAMCLKEWREKCAVAKAEKAAAESVKPGYQASGSVVSKKAKVGRK